jgi:hypothetical protein
MVENRTMPITLRLAEQTDDGALRRLAERDSATVPPGPHLLAIRDGDLEAAISLSTGEIVADPFRHTAEARELLRCATRRRTPGSGQSRRRIRRPVLRERLA